MENYVSLWEKLRLSILPLNQFKHRRRIPQQPQLRLSVMYRLALYVLNFVMLRQRAA